VDCRGRRGVGLACWLTPPELASPLVVGGAAGLLVLPLVRLGLAPLASTGIVIAEWTSRVWNPFSIYRFASGWFSRNDESKTGVLSRFS